MSIEHLSKIGGIFAVLYLIHYIADWVFQSHDEAMAKSSNYIIRAMHCINYIVPFAILFVIINFDLNKAALCINILFWSHFLEDTYIPVVLWAKYIRKPPEMISMDFHIKYNLTGDSYTWPLLPPERTDAERFKLWLKNDPIAYLLMIQIDQIVHYIFLFIVAIIMVS